MLLVGLDGCEVRLCGPCAFVRPRVPCVSRLPPVSFYRVLLERTGTGTPDRDPCGRGRARLERRILTLVLKYVIRTDQHGSMQTAALHSPDIRHLSLYMYILKHVRACPRKREGELKVSAEREGESIYEIVGNVAATRGVSSEV